MKVLLSSPFMKKIMEKFEKEFTVIIPQTNETFKEVLLKHPDISAIIAPLTTTIDAPLLDLAPQLKLICSEGVGYDHIDVLSAKKRQICVTHTPGGLNHAVADLVFTLILSTARRLKEAVPFTQQGLFTGYDKNLFLGKELFNSTIGIIGMGRIGEAIAQRAKGFGMNIIYASRSPKPLLESRYSMRHTPLDSLLQESDIIVPMINFSPEFHHLFNKKRFSLLKKDALFINASRGKIVDEQALVAWLKENPLAAAGLDVYEFEPRIHPELLTLDNAICLPHIGSATRETRFQMAQMNFESLMALKTSQEIPHQIADPI